MIRILLTVLIISVMSGTVQGPSPNVNQVIDSYLRAVGGEAAFAKFTTRIRQGTTEIVGLPGQGQVEEYYKAPNKMMIKLTLPAIGTIQYGYDGTSGWRRDPVSGLIDVHDKELSDLAFESMFNSEVRPRERYGKLELIGLKKARGNDAYLVVGTPAKLPAEQLYFDAKSGLLVQIVVSRATEAGQVSDEVFLDDYREIDNVKIPYREQHKSSGLTYIVRFTSIKHNIPIDESTFRKPDRK